MNDDREDGPHGLSPARDGGPADIVYELADDERPSEGVVRAVSVATNRSAVELEPLVRTIDPDALDRLVEPRSDTWRTVIISFRYAGCTVEVEGTRRVLVRL